MTVSNALNNFYPDLLAAGGLTPALQSGLQRIGSNLTASALEKPENFVVYARVESGPRFSQMYIASEQRQFLLDFWARGVCLAKAQTSDLDQAAAAINKWIASTCTTAELETTFPFVATNEEAAVYEKGEEVQNRWNNYLESIHIPQLVPFIRAAFQREKLRQLFPFTSHSTFCFSRCTGYPFTHDTPCVRPLENGEYEVTNPSGAVLGRGDPEQAALLVEANLPMHCGPARPGTAEDSNS